MDCPKTLLKIIVASSAMLMAQIALAQYPIPTRDSSAAAQNRTTNYSPGIQATALLDAGRHLSTVSAKASPSVVHIESTRPGRNGTLEETGSGVIMSSPRVNGLFVVTNRHVVTGATLNSIEILLSDGRVIYPTEKVEDPNSDIAVLRIDDTKIPAAQWGDSDNLDIGHFVLAMGSPFGLSQSVTLGIISAKGRRSLELPGRRVINQDFLQTDAAINPGNSGGPLVDLDGRIIGINTAIASQGGGNEGIGFSIPSNLVKFIVAQLLENGQVNRGYLGVELDENFDIETARKYTLTRKYGARVTRVMDRTPASQAGILPDDIILDFDGVEVADENDLINRVSLTPVNKRVRMIVMRKGRQETLYVVLAEREEEQSALPQEMLPQELLPEVDYYNAGLAVFELSDEIAVQMGYVAGQQGVMVQKAPVTAIDNGLQLYDVIEEVARHPVQNLSDFNTALDCIAGQKEVVLKVTRVINNEPQSLLVIWKR